MNHFIISVSWKFQRRRLKSTRRLKDFSQAIKFQSNTLRQLVPGEIQTTFGNDIKSMAVIGSIAYVAINKWILKVDLSGGGIIGKVEVLAENKNFLGIEVYNENIMVFAEGSRLIVFDADLKKIDEVKSLPLDRLYTKTGVQLHSFEDLYCITSTGMLYAIDSYMSLRSTCIFNWKPDLISHKFETINSDVARVATFDSDSRIVYIRLDGQVHIDNKVVFKRMITNNSTVEEYIEGLAATTSNVVIALRTGSKSGTHSPIFELWSHKGNLLQSVNRGELMPTRSPHSIRSMKMVKIHNLDVIVIASFAQYISLIAVWKDSLNVLRKDMQLQSTDISLIPNVRWSISSMVKNKLVIMACGFPSQLNMIVVKF